VRTGLTMREIEKAVAGRKPGDLPGDPPDLELVRHRLRFEVPAETLALFREARRLMRDQAGERSTTARSLPQCAAPPSVAAVTR
jgi:hypothetical protein